MGKRANPMAVKAALTYEVIELAKALGVSHATIRNWIKDGLPVLSDKKPTLISGQAAREYLKEKNRSQKSPLEFDQLYCVKCRAGRKPNCMMVEVVANTSKTTRLKGSCGQCGATAGRIISNSKTHEFAQTFNFNKGGSSAAY
jgi:hypothetical protein